MNRRSDDGLPLVIELPSTDTAALFLRMQSLPHCIFFDSARRDHKLGRYSFLAADPFEYFELSVSEQDAFVALASRLALWQTPTAPEIPPFQGGAAGLFSYDLNHGLEK